MRIKPGEQMYVPSESLPIVDDRVERAQSERHEALDKYDPGDKVSVRAPEREMPRIHGVVVKTWYNDFYKLYVVVVKLETGVIIKVEASRVKRVKRCRKR